jgi:hypothetical protein
VSRHALAALGLKVLSLGAEFGLAIALGGIEHHHDTVWRSEVLGRRRHEVHLRSEVGARHGAGDRTLQVGLWRVERIADDLD